MVHQKLCEKGWKWVKLDENAMSPISPMWKKHQNLLSNYNDAQSITTYGFLIGPDAQNSCTARTALQGPPTQQHSPCLKVVWCHRGYLAIPPCAPPPHDKFCGECSNEKKGHCHGYMPVTIGACFTHLNHFFELGNKKSSHRIPLLQRQTNPAP